MWLFVPAALVVLVFVVFMISRGPVVGFVWAFGLVCCDALVTLVVVSAFAAATTSGSDDYSGAFVLVLGSYSVFIGAMLAATVNEIVQAVAIARLGGRGDRC